MQLNTHGNTHFKGAAKNLAKELENQGFKISHSNALNITAVTLGYKNYNTYTALNQDTNHIDPKSARSLEEETDKTTKNFYPSIKDRFAVFPNIKSEQFNTYVYREENEERDLYYLLFEVKRNITGRVFYSPEYDSVLLFVYPTIESGISDYVINLHEVDSDKLFKNFFYDILHLLRTKIWATSDLLSDTMELMEALVATRDNLREINKSRITYKDLKAIFENSL